MMSCQLHSNNFTRQEVSTPIHMNGCGSSTCECINRGYSLNVSSDGHSWSSYITDKLSYHIDTETGIKYFTIIGHYFGSATRQGIQGTVEYLEPDQFDHEDGWSIDEVARFVQVVDSQCHIVFEAAICSLDQQNVTLGTRDLYRFPGYPVEISSITFPSFFVESMPCLPPIVYEEFDSSDFIPITMDEIMGRSKPVAAAELDGSVAAAELNGSVATAELDGLVATAELDESVATAELEETVVMGEPEERSDPTCEYLMTQEFSLNVSSDGRRWTRYITEKLSTPSTPETEQRFFSIRGSYFGSSTRQGSGGTLEYRNPDDIVPEDEIDITQVARFVQIVDKHGQLVFESAICDLDQHSVTLGTRDLHRWPGYPVEISSITFPGFFVDNFRCLPPIVHDHYDLSGCTLITMDELMGMSGSSTLAEAHVPVCEEEAFCL